MGCPRMLCFLFEDYKTLIRALPRCAPSKATPSARCCWKHAAAERDGTAATISSRRTRSHEACEVSQVCVVEHSHSQRGD